MRRLRTITPSNFLPAIILPSLLLLGIILSVGCSDSADNPNNPNTTPVTGLSLPRSINFNGANVTQNSANIAAAAIVAVQDANSQFITDPVSEMSFSENNIAMGLTNIMLCLMDELNATDKVNQGAFKADVPQSICKKNKQNSTISSPFNFTVLSTRKNNQSPHIIQLWLHDQSIPAEPIYVIGEFIITAGVSDVTPYGVFEFNYDLLIDTSTVGESPGKIIKMGSASVRSIQTSDGLPRLEFRNEQYEYIAGTTSSEFSSVTAMLDGTSGRGQAWELFNFYNPTLANFVEYQTLVDFNADYSLSNSPFFSVSTQAPVDICYSRNEKIADVWSYNLYFNLDMEFNGQTVIAGQRVEFADTGLTQLDFTYIHTAGNDRNYPAPLVSPYQDTEYNLRYFGPGQLEGIPWDGNSFLNQINLVDGTVMRNSAGEQFITKAIDIGIQALSVDISECVGLDAAAVIDNIALDPSNVAAITPVTIGMSDWPTI